MAALTESRFLVSEAPNVSINRSFPIAAGETIFAGAVVGINGAGEAVPATTSTKIVGVSFVGGQGDNGDYANVTFNNIWRMPFPGVTAAAIGEAVAVQDDSGLVALGAGTSVAGRVVKIEADYAYVKLECKA